MTVIEPQRIQKATSLFILLRCVCVCAVSDYWDGVKGFIIYLKWK